MFYCFPVIVTLLSIHLVLFCFVQFYFRSSAFIYWPGGTWALIFFGFQSTVGADTWSVYRRYRKFRELHKTMQKSYYEVLILMFFFLFPSAQSMVLYSSTYKGWGVLALCYTDTVHYAPSNLSAPPPPPKKKKYIGPSTCKQKIHSAISPHGYESPLL